MTNNEYLQLVEFLGRKFTEVDVRLDQTATKEELREQQAEARRQFEAVAEGLRSEIRQVAEGVLNVDENLGRFRQEVQTGFGEIKAMIKFSHAELDRGVHILEDAVVSLRGRVERLEARQS